MIRTKYVDSPKGKGLGLRKDMSQAVVAVRYSYHCNTTAEAKKMEVHQRAISVHVAMSFIW